MVRATRLPDGEFELEYFDHFRFVPLVGRSGWQASDLESR
jgi:hypothetical protein